MTRSCTRAPEHPWVSRGGVKLAAALDHFGFEVAGHVCLDVGASTGGFTEVLLARGAARVYAVDVGRGQLHARLREDKRVVSLEATDIRTLDPTALAPVPDFATIDVSFISLKLVLPALDRLLRQPAHLIALIKPQFEAGPKHVKKGIVRDLAMHEAVCEEIAVLASIPRMDGRGDHSFADRRRGGEQGVSDECVPLTRRTHQSLE